MGLERLSRLPKKNDLITQVNEVIHTVAIEGFNERLILNESNYTLLFQAKIESTTAKSSHY